MEITINNKKVTVQAGQKILDALKENNISVPTLCHMKDMFPTGACRLCVVEVDGRRGLVPSCSEPVAEGMNIKTHSSRVVKARKTIVELLLSNHPDDCLYCERNNNCELQNLADTLNVRERRIMGPKKEYSLDASGHSIQRDPDKCILCGRCVRVCEEIQSVSAIDFIGRGNKTVIATAFDKGLNVSSCINCGQCILVCPTGALKEKNNLAKVKSALNNKDKHVVIQYAPSITVSIAEALGMPAGEDVIGLLNAALHSMGFDAVFDSSFTADLTIMEEGNELIQRVQNGGTLPMFTSCCPAWVKFVEQFYPELIPNISTCKSPQQMMGAVIKSYYAEQKKIDPENIYSVSIMPCTAKKFEDNREQMADHGIADVDTVITTRELIRLIKMFGIDFKNLEPELADDPLGKRSTAGKLFGASGGVMEAAIRTAYFKLTGKELENLEVPEVRGMEGRKEAKVNIDGLEVGVAVVSGLKNARELIAEIKNGRSDLHFIEVMTCPGGCINGGGQPIGVDEENIKKRAATLYKLDDTEELRVSHKNPQVLELYEKFLGEPLGHKSHELLHTTYAKRDDVLL